jgi:hypothetical protein
MFAVYTTKIPSIELGGGVPLRYDRAKTPPVGEACQQWRGDKYQTWGIYTGVLSSLLFISISTAYSGAKQLVAKLDSPRLIRFLAVEPMQPHNRGIIKGGKVLRRL